MCDRPLLWTGRGVLCPVACLGWAAGHSSHLTLALLIGCPRGPVWSPDVDMTSFILVAFTKSSLKAWHHPYCVSSVVSLVPPPLYGRFHLRHIGEETEAQRIQELTQSCPAAEGLGPVLGRGRQLQSHVSNRCARGSHPLNTWLCAG